MEEIWKEVSGFERYQVSNIGKVKRLAELRWSERNQSYGSYKERLLKPEIDKDGYLRVRLHQDGISKKMFVHRLVAVAFILNLENKPQVNHMDGVKDNNLVHNLEWVTRSEQRIHAYKIGLNRADGEHNGQSKLTQKEVNEIRILYKVGRTHQEISNRYDMSRAHITGIINHTYWNSTYDIDLIYKYK